MGKYSFALLKTLLSEHCMDVSGDVVLIFNDTTDIPDEINSLVDSNDSVRKMCLPLIVPSGDVASGSVEPARQANKKLLTERLEEALGNGNYDYMILALYVEDACSTFPASTGQKLLVYYDAIPYLYFDRYKQFDGYFDNFYLPHTATVYEATKLLTISKTVTNDLRLTFGIPEEKIFTINGAAIVRATETSKKPKLTITKEQYVLMPTGQELRKNNPRAVRAFDKFNRSSERKLKLVITSQFTKEERDRLTAINENVVFSGNVSESEMKWLFDNAKLILFPSEYEGLGLPLLEAVDSNKKIACSDISVFREMSTAGFFFFDPQSEESITETLTRASSTELKEREAEYKNIQKQYTWEESARLFNKAFRAPIIPPKSKKKIAILCPDPSGFSAVGKVVAESHAWYTEYFDVTYYFDRGLNHRIIRPNPLPALAPCKKASDFNAEDYNQFDAVIYHIGNSEYHLDSIHAALAMPGYIILHDTFLDGAFSNLLNMGYISGERRELEGRLDELLEKGEVKGSYLTTLVNNAYGVLVHSNYAKQVVRSRLLKGARCGVVKVNLPVTSPVFANIVKPSRERVTISFAGIIANVKGIDMVVDIANSGEYNGVTINIFGFSAVEQGQLELLKTLPHVNVITNPSDFIFRNYMAASDIIMNVRTAYRGETSMTTLEAMSFGDTVLVRDIGWYSELPEGTVVKVASPEHSIPQLDLILSDSAKREMIRANASQYIRLHHTHKGYALGMYNLIEKQKEN
jgi:glycosyltransferase involved in cell wall biosynthesis